ncbi:MAG: hypothetical protein ABR866_08240 [Candidatus Korobacteraceae bacterium]|jgi:hypothetical protein
MQNCSLLTLVVFLLGCAIGALLNSIYRASTLARVKEAFERELEPPSGQQTYTTTK